MSSRYEILEPLGEGGAGAVFKAWDHRLQRPVAIKRLLPPEQREGEGVGTDLLKEAGALSSLQHPNIVSVYDLDEMDGEPVVVMEFLNGETLEQTMRRGALTLGDFTSVARQSLQGLVAAHRLGVQHRDIKPSNIMVSWLPNGDFLVKMLDFGLADFTARPQVQEQETAGTIYGSIYFMAPEQFLRQPADVRTDLYALGCVFYYALTGAYPFNGQNVEDLIQAHLNHACIPVQRLRNDAPPVLAQWIGWLMQRQPENRPQSAEEALRIFLQLQAGTLKSLPQVAPVRPAPATAPVPIANPRPQTPVPVRTTAVRPPVPKPPPVVEAPRPANPQPLPRPPVPATTPAPATKPSPSPKTQQQNRLVLIGVLAVVIVITAIIIATTLSKRSAAPPSVDPNQPPLPDPIVWLRSDIGMKTKRGQNLALLGDHVDLWQDQAPLGGANHGHYINTGSSEEDRLRHLPLLREFTLAETVYQVLHFDGKAFMLLATDFSPPNEIPSSLTEHTQPLMTYGFIAHFLVDTGKHVLLAPGAPDTQLWELYTEQGKLWFGANGDGRIPASLDLPTGEQFLAVLVTIDTPQRRAQLFITDAAGVTTASAVAENFPTATTITRMRLCARGFTDDVTPFHGDLAEVLLYHHLLTDAERAQFQKYFLRKYGKRSS